MDFKLVVCPKCGNKQIENLVIVGTYCNSCKIGLHHNSEDIKKDIRQEQVAAADTFSRNFDEFKKRLEREEERWNKENVFVEFKTVTIDDDKLLELLDWE